VTLRGAPATRWPRIAQTPPAARCAAGRRVMGPFMPAETGTRAQSDLGVGAVDATPRRRAGRRRGWCARALHCCGGRGLAAAITRAAFTSVAGAGQAHPEQRPLATVPTASRRRYLNCVHNANSSRRCL